jgi:tRNA-modifying protein YgfZ
VTPRGAPPGDGDGRDPAAPLARPWQGSPWQAVLPDAAVAAAGLVGVVDGALAHLGDALDEVRALGDGEPVAAPLVRHGALRVLGPDRLDFLNGLVSHEVRALPPAGARSAMLLDHRGRAQADVTVVRREDDLYVAVDDGRAALVQEVLRAHVVFDQVEVEDRTDALVALVVSGHEVAGLVDRALSAPGGSAADALAAGPGAVVQRPFGSASVLLHARHRASVPSLDLHLLARDLDDLVEALRGAGARLVGEVALAAARIEAGIASSTAEGVEALPQEAGLEGRLSYRKGCYLGQEIMARVEARGSLRRGPARLALSSAPTDSADRSVRDGEGRPVGRVGTAAPTVLGWRALAVLRLDVAVGAPLRALGVEARHAGALGRAT